MRAVIPVIIFSLTIATTLIGVSSNARKKACPQFERTNRRKGVRPVIVPKNQTQVRRNLGRVVNGMEIADNYLFPYQVTLRSYQFNGSHFCGGTIYNKQVIITAAHCFYENPKVPIPASDVYIVAGENSLDGASNTSQTANVTEVKFWPNYRLNPGFNDIALLKLATPLKFSMFVSPIRIAKEDEEPEGKGRISGWGYTVPMGEIDTFNADKYTRILIFADLDIINKSVCSELHANIAPDHAAHKKIICAGSLTGTSDTCQGDSGGPLACYDKEKGLYLCGVVQAGIGCGQQIPGFYTKISNFVDFIREYAGSQVDFAIDTNHGKGFLSFSFISPSPNNATGSLTFVSQNNSTKL